MLQTSPTGVEDIPRCGVDIQRRAQNCTNLSTAKFVTTAKVIQDSRFCRDRRQLTFALELNQGPRSNFEIGEGGGHFSVSILGGRGAQVTFSY